MNESTVSSPHWLVLRDVGNFLRGDVINASQSRAVPFAGTDTTIPVDPGLLRVGGLNGFARADLGRAATLGDSPSVVASLAIRATTGCASLHWRAYLVADDALRDRLRGGQPPVGSLRVLPDVIVSPLAADLGVGGQEELAKLGAADARNGWVIGGHCDARFGAVGYYGLRLFGYGSRGMRVEWFACSVLETR